MRLVPSPSRLPPPESRFISIIPNRPSPPLSASPPTARCDFRCIYQSDGRAGFEVGLWGCRGGFRGVGREPCSSWQDLFRGGARGLGGVSEWRVEGLDQFPRWWSGDWEAFQRPDQIPPFVPFPDGWGESSVSVFSCRSIGLHGGTVLSLGTTRIWEEGDFARLRHLEYPAAQR